MWENCCFTVTGPLVARKSYFWFLAIDLNFPLCLQIKLTYLMPHCLEKQCNPTKVMHSIRRTSRPSLLEDCCRKQKENFSNKLAYDAERFSSSEMLDMTSSPCSGVNVKWHLFVEQMWTIDPQAPRCFDKPESFRNRWRV